MSLFQEQHHDRLLLSHLDIDSIIELSSVNRYYYKLTKHILQPFKTFFAIRNNLILDIADCKPINPCSFLHLKCYDIMLIQAYIYKNKDIISYLNNKFPPNEYMCYHKGVSLECKEGQECFWRISLTKLLYYLQQYKN